MRPATWTSEQPSEADGPPTRATRSRVEGHRTKAAGSARGRRAVVEESRQGDPTTDRAVATGGPNRRDNK